MVKQKTFFELKHYHENSEDYYQHMAHLRGEPIVKSKTTSRYDKIFEAYSKEKDKKIGSAKFNSCLRSFPAESDKFESVLMSMSDDEMEKFCELDPIQRKKIVRKYL